DQFDVIVVGGGHAGTEAALASARMGSRTLLLTHSIETLGQMSCNPSIGGIGKGHLAKEVDALGGAMAEATDEAGIQFRILNSSKGPAVRATRAQADRVLYRQAIRRRLENQPNLWLFQHAVDDLMVEDVRAARARAGGVLDRRAFRRRLENQPNLWLFQEAVGALMVGDDRVVGAVTQRGLRFRARAVGLTAGTFLNGLVHVGLAHHSAG